MAESVLYGNFGGTGRVEGGLMESCQPKVCGLCHGLKVYRDEAGSWPCGWCKGSGLEPTMKPAVRVTIDGDDFPSDGEFPEEPAR